MAMRYFYEKMLELHVIAAGSLLEFAFSEISFHVGRIQSMEVHPMNFSEFLLALDFTRAAEEGVSPEGLIINSKVLFSPTAV